MWKHYVVRACTPKEPFRDFNDAQWVWRKLLRLFPEMLAAVLMPNHLHLILPEDQQGDKNCRKLNGLLGAISHWNGEEKLWQPIPPPAEIPDRHHLRRQIRYVALNPCRKGLCRDPLQWYWSTYRDIIGATPESRPTARQVAHVLRETETGFSVRFHRYVSGDPSVAINGTPIPHPAIPKDLAEYGIGEILDASASALRALPADIKKKGPLRALFIHMAARHGWRRTTSLATLCEISTRAVSKHFSQSISLEQIAAADMCLGDRRLRRHALPSATPIDNEY